MIDLMQPYAAPHPAGARPLTSEQVLANLAHGRAFSEAAKAADDLTLIRAYNADLERSSFGVNYTLGQEMEARGLRSARTAKLTKKAAKLMAS